MRIQLRVRAAKDREYPWEYREREFIVGRGPGCALRFEAASAEVVSWEHARIELCPEGASILDIGSSNGTFVNGNRIHRKTPLKPTDVVTLGQTGPVLEIMAVEVEEPPPPSPPPERRQAAARPARRPPISLAPSDPAAGKATLHQPVSPAQLLPQRVGGDQPSTIYRLMARLQRGQRLGYWLAGGLLVCIVAGVVVVLAVPRPTPQIVLKENPQPEKKDENSDKDVGKRVYNRLIHSVVCLMNIEPKSLNVGSGTLIDRHRRLILTNAHVAQAGSLTVYFPEWRDGKLITEHEYYIAHCKPYRARVLRMDTKHDMALLQLDALPADAVPLALADASASPGDMVHSIGNPSVSALWTYSSGTVRQVCRKQHTLLQGNQIDSQVLVTQAPINSGDSGSAVVNNSEKLVGVNYGGSIKAGVRNVTYAIDLSEVRALLDTLPP